MNLRDLAIVAAVVLLAGFALADALRSDPPTTPSAETETDAGTTAADTETEADAPVESERRRRIFDSVAAAGSLVVTEGPDCELREVSISTGVELPQPRVTTSCELWAPAQGKRVAYGLSTSGEDASRFRFAELAHPERNLGAFEGVPGSLVWSPDGRRAAWCDAGGTGYEYEIGRALDELERCPDGYADDGNLAFADERRIVVDGQPAVEASRPIDAFHWGTDGSVAVLLDDGTVERHGGGALVSERLPEGERPPVLAPDNCAALVARGGLVELVDLGCFDDEEAFTKVSPDNCLDRRNVTIAECARFRAPRTFVGSAATWSPDGTWIAVAEPRAVAFHRVVGRYDAVRWSVRSGDLAWLD